jgi:aminomethyltransferase
MLLRSPFHDRVAEANQTSLWSHWAGHLVVDRYQMSEKWEYTAIRNAVGVFDASPLYKYRITGPDAERFLGAVLARDIRRCRPGEAHYTIWCDDRGYLNEDGVVFRHGPDEFLLTAAEPNLSYLRALIGYDQVEVEDVSEQCGVLAVQGPRSHAVLAALAPEVSGLGFFEHIPARIGQVPVTISRTGFTGDLGYEVFCPAGDALTLWDHLTEAGTNHGLTPIGQIALLMARIEAGLILINVDFEVSRRAENDEHRSTPYELGLGWMLGGIDDPTRPFVGRRALVRAREDRSARWALVGLGVDPADHHARYTEADLTPPKDHRPIHGDAMVYDGDGQRVGYATSSMYSPMLQRHIALARVRPELATVGQRVFLEFTINHRYVKVAAEVARNPLFNPARKTAPPIRPGGHP